MEDLARAVEMRAERLRREVEELARAFGLVEVEIVAGEEPEEGVGLEAVAGDDEDSHFLVGPVDCVDGVLLGLCWSCGGRGVASDRPCAGK